MSVGARIGIAFAVGILRSVLKPADAGIGGVGGIRAAWRRGK